MSIIKIGEGKYRVDIRPQGREGKRIRKLFTTKKEAQQYERHALATQNNKDWLEKPADRRPLTELIELWWKYHGQTLKSGDSDRKKLIKMAGDLGFPRASQINISLFSDYRAQRITNGIKPTTINRMQVLLSSVFTVLIKTNNYNNQHPLKGISKLKINNHEMSFLSKEHISLLLDNLHGDDLKAVKLGLATGGRWGEINNIKRSAVIKYKITYINTKNGKNRTIPISRSLYNELTEGTNPVLLANASYREVSHIINRLFPWLPDGQAVHVLRHTFASHFMMNGGNILTLQKILGHATIAQTMTYAHFAPDHLQDAVNLNPLEYK
ncbi:tyrosine-type recombinase/integrase [Salmonella enterica]|nr:integrase [Salmonella enterica]EDJ5493156.1 integrase [Salmonella enterica]EIR5838016.1 tyrosine-type recombinase/integrase [Salmonella enterica]